MLIVVISKQEKGTELAIPLSPSRGCFNSGSGFARLQSPMALSASIDDKTNIACCGLRALGLLAQAWADDPLLKHPLSKSHIGLGEISFE